MELKNLQMILVVSIKLVIYYLNKGLLHGLDAFSHIMDLLGFDNSANNLSSKLLENAKTLVD